MLLGRMTIIMLAAAMLSGCGVKMDIPQDFIRIENDKPSPYSIHAISADGVSIAVRREDNHQEGTLGFWAKAIENVLVNNREYKLVNTEDVVSGKGVSGRMMIFTAKKEGFDYTYISAVFVSKRAVLVAEAGGRSEMVKPLSGELRKSMLTVR